MKNNKDSSKGINRKSFKRTGRKGTSKRIRGKRPRLKKYSKRKNLKKSNKKMKGGGDLEKVFEEGSKIVFGGNALLWDGNPPFRTPERGASYLALKGGMVMEGGGELLGKGSFGQVRQFTIVDSEIETEKDTVVAVKIMIRNPTSFPDEEIFKKFVYREYEYQRELSTHEHSKYFVKVYNFFQLEEKEKYGIAMELLPKFHEEGLELSDLIKARSLSDKEKVHYSLELARAISATHKMGIVHCDLKPENVAIAADGIEMGQLKLMDFGLSFKAGDDESNNKIDCCNEVPMGSHFYFSYEIQEIYLKTKTVTIPGRKYKKTTTHYGAASDWWSYGVMVFEMIIGKLNENNHPCLFGNEMMVGRGPIITSRDIFTWWNIYFETEAMDIDSCWPKYKEKVLNFQLGVLESEKRELHRKISRAKQVPSTPKTQIIEWETKVTKKGQILQNVRDSLQHVKNPTKKERLLLKLAFQFFVKDPKERPFLCLDEPQMKDYDGTTGGEKAGALKKIVAELERLERLERLESSE